MCVFQFAWMLLEWDLNCTHGLIKMPRNATFQINGNSRILPI